MLHRFWYYATVLVVIVPVGAAVGVFIAWFRGGRTTALVEMAADEANGMQRIADATWWGAVLGAGIGLLTGLWIATKSYRGPE